MIFDLENGSGRLGAGIDASGGDQVGTWVRRGGTILLSPGATGPLDVEAPVNGFEPETGGDWDAETGAPGQAASQVIDASVGPNLLSGEQAVSAINANRRLGAQLGWAKLYTPISIYYMRYQFFPVEPVFVQAVARWKRALGLPADGVLDGRTWNIMRLRGEPNAFVTADGLARPRGYAQVVAAFGNPAQNNAAWERANIVRASAPPGLSFQRFTGGLTPTVRVHRRLRTHFEALFRAIAGAGLWNEIQPISGPYAFRNVRGSTRLSMHAFGIAIDINPKRFARRQTRNFPHPRVIRLFQDHGFHWGMFFNNPDAMHFQFATGA